MVAWGLGHNLEKNLQKARALREKGEDRRALELLLGWAEKHEDSPHYLYEAALAAFDLKDAASGLNSIKTLLRRFPDTREKILGACGEHFQSSPNLPLAEFLIDDHTAAHRFAEAFGVVDRVSPSEAATYTKRVAMRHQSLSATPNTPDAKVLQIQASRLVAGHALKDAAVFLDAIRALLELDAGLVEGLTALCEAEDPDQVAEIEMARGCCLAAADKIPEACRSWIRAVRRQATLSADLRTALDKVTPQKKERGLWLAAQGEVALVDGDGDRASDLFGEACEADASLREEILEILAGLAEGTPVSASASLAKLRLRLYVVLHRAEEAAQFSRELRENEVVELAEIRRLMHGSGDDADDTALQTAVAEAALFDHDLAGAAEQANAISDKETGSLRRLLDAVDSVREEWPGDTRASLHSFGAVLAARAKDHDRCNYLLAEIWSQDDADSHAAMSVTRRCLETVPAQRSFVSAACGVLLDRGAEDFLRELVDRVFGVGDAATSPKSPATIDGFQSVQFDANSSSDIDMDLGGLEREEAEDLADVLLELLEQDAERSACLLTALDGCAASVDARTRFRQPIAYAALFTGDFDRALGELAVLQVTGGEEMAISARRYCEAALTKHPDSSVLRAALADLQAESGDLLSAAGQLAEALRQNPKACDEISRRFDKLLDRDLGLEAGSLWITYAEALFDTGRFGQLRVVCDRGRDQCDEQATGRLDLLATRVMVEEGRLTEALQAVQKLLRGTEGDSERVVAILEAILKSHPGSAAAHFLMGEACHRAARPEDALAAWSHAVECDESLATRVGEKIQGLQAHAAIGGGELFRMAKYHVGRKNWSEAARMLEHAIRVDESVAARVLGEFESRVEGKDASLDLMLAVAEAARVGGRPETACDLLSRVDQCDAARIEAVLTGFRRLRESYESDLEAVAAMARVLMRHQMADAAGRSVAEAGHDQNYDADERQALLWEFHRRCPEDTEVALALAHLLGEQDRVSEAATVLEEPATLRHADVNRCLEIVEVLRKKEPGLARLCLLAHDLLLRAGRIEEGLNVLPLAETVESAELTELSSRFEAHREAALRHLQSAENYGRALWKQGRHPDALEALRHAVFTLDPEPAAAIRWSLAEFLVQSDLASEAAKVLDLENADAEQRRHAYDQLAKTSLDRLDAEIETLKVQWECHPGAAHVATRLAQRLLQRGHASDAEEVLLRLETEGDAQVRRSILLAEIRLELGRADRAESVLRHLLAGEVEGRPRQRAEYLMAHCARRLARPAEARARYQNLQDHCEDNHDLSSITRQAYTDDLADVAGDFRAVLMGVGDLDAELQPLQEQS
jgi:tetratricopeptide (TPR) repeat protein